MGKSTRAQDQGDSRTPSDCTLTSAQNGHSKLVEIMSAKEQRQKIVCRG